MPTQKSPTSRSASQKLPKPRQLSGPGIPGSETDTPLFHIDVDQNQLADLMASPVEYLARIGLGKREGIAPGGSMSVTVGRPDIRWTPTGWEQVGAADEVGAWCCHVVGDTTYCYQH